MNDSREETDSSSMPIPAPRKFKTILNSEKYEIKQTKTEFFQSISYDALNDNIIWLDLFANERNLTFADNIVAIGKLNIFNTAVDCMDFFDSSAREHNSLLVRTTYLVIVSGMYAINEKVIRQLLQYGFIDQIYLIVNECYYGTSLDLFILDRKLSVIYNDDSDRVMYWLCKDYSNYETFIQQNNGTHTTIKDQLNNVSNDILQENVDIRMIYTYRWSISYDYVFTRLMTKDNVNCNRSTTSDTLEDKIVFDNTPSSRQHMMFRDAYGTNQSQEANHNIKGEHIASSTICDKRSDARLLPMKNAPSPLGMRSSSYQQMNLVECPLPLLSQYPNDVSASEELEQIKDNVVLLNGIIDQLQIHEPTRDDCLYKQIEEHALQLMIRCNGLTDISSKVRAIRREVIHNIQQMLSKLD